MSPFLSFSSHLLLFLLLILIFHIPTSTSTQESFLYVQCSVNTNGNTSTPVTNYTINSTFHTNLKQLLPNLAASVSLSNGFYSTYSGQEPNKVYGLVSCRSDTSPDVCRNCSTEASNSILRQCQSRSSAIWYDYCQLVYSDTDFILSSTTPWWFWVWSPNNVTDTELVPFQTALGTLMSDLASKAAYKPLPPKFATGEKNYLGIKKVYGLVQCKLVISGEDCYRCLVNAIRMLPACCDWRMGGRVAGLVCNIRFETTLFFGEISLVAGPAPFPPPTVALPPLTDQTNAGRGRERKLLLIIAAIVIVGVSLLGTIMYCLWRKINKNDDTKMHNNSSDVSIFGERERRDIDVPFYEFESVLQATENFSDSNKLGQGGFGHVYKGKLSEGQELAVKRLSKSSGQGQEEFKNEVMLIAKLQHRNLVRLLGYCIQGDERILLYEYMPNKSLDYFLFDPNRSKLLSWEKRHNIILGLAKGLLYLHEDSRLRIIHRDLKTSNILLDEEMKPKISDFGIARIFGVNQNQANTNRVVGTYGYMSPEYAFHGLFSVKSDVFSFGVILLEIISGKKNSLFYHNEESLTLLGYAWKLLEEEKWMDFIDVNFKEACTLPEVLKCFQIALLCVQENTVDRPTMASVVRMFISEATTLQPPKQPAFITRNLPNPNSSIGSKNEITTSILEGR